MKNILYKLFKKSFIIGAGLTVGVLATAILAVVVNYTYTWSDTDVLYADHLNQNFTDVKNALLGIPDWEKGTNPLDAVYMAGNVGIGTTSPNASYKLHVNGDVMLGDGVGDLKLRGIPATGGNFIISQSSGTGSIQFASSANTSLVTIENNGNVGIGTTLPNSLLTIASSYPVFGILDNNSSGTAAVGRINWYDQNESDLGQIGYTSSTDSNLEIRNIANADLEFWTNNLQQMVIEPGGDVGIGTSSPNVALDVIGSIEYTGTISDVSDERLKENIEAISDPIGKLENINGIYYNMRGSKKRELGVIAQNVQQAIPEAVSIVDEEKNYLGVNYVSLVPVLIEALKEQQNTINELKARIARIERNKK
jgi:hypothetical protein